MKISNTFSSSSPSSFDESSSLIVGKEAIDGGIEGGSCIGGMGGREDEEEEVSLDVVAGLLKGNATRLFRLIFKFPVGGGTNFGGSFQPDKKVSLI